MTLDSALLTASAAVIGSLVGAAAMIATTWLTQRNQAIRGHFEWNFREREGLYGEFIKESSRLAVDALHHSLDDPEKFVALYGVLGRIRLISGDEVLQRAEECVEKIVDLYSQPNLTAEQIRVALKAHGFDPVKDFSSACRVELQEMAPALMSVAAPLKSSQRARSRTVHV